MVQAKAPHGVDAPGRAPIGKRTLRIDRWWAQPLVTWIGFSLWLAYGLYRTMVQRNYYVAEWKYLTPFYSPCVTASCTPESRDFGTWFGPFPPLIPFAIITLVFLLGFRLTCYYYRKAYYRSFWRSPSACAVPEPHSKYSGETRFPLVVQNIHRYLFYAAVLISLVNTYDLVKALTTGIGLGTVIMFVNVVLLWCYTGGCHACRHVIGGRLRHFSKHPIRYWLWGKVGILNNRHMNFALITLVTLVITDLYIALLAAGVFSDPRLINW